MEEQAHLKILFWGNYIPLQGVQFIVRAAALLCNEGNIKFTMIGGGQMYNKIIVLAQELKVTNIHFIGHLPLDQLPSHINNADICLGIFGDTEKTNMVIPNKAYETIAMRKPLITADTPAIRELFTDQKDILLCRAADPEDLAQKIRFLYGNIDTRSRIAECGYDTYKANCTPAIIGNKLLDALKQAI